jgi:hypothetical protein
MKWLKYTFRTVVTDTDMEGNETQREIFTEASVPDNEQGRTLAEMEAWNGVIVEYDDGEVDPEPADNDEYADMASAIREGVNGI